MKPVQDNISEEDFRGGEALSQRELVLRLIQKINDENFKRADNLIIDTPRGIKVLDVRETRINAIRDLKTLLQPKFDEAIKKEVKKIDGFLENIEKKFGMICIGLEANARVRYIKTKKNEKFREIIQSLIKSGYFTINKDGAEYDTFLHHKSNLYQMLFDELIYLLDRLNWLTSDSATE